MNRALKSSPHVVGVTCSLRIVWKSIKFSHVSQGRRGKLRDEIDFHTVDLLRESLFQSVDRQVTSWNCFGERFSPVFRTTAQTAW